MIGGSGLYSLDDVADAPAAERRDPETPWGKPSSQVTIREIGGAPVAFIARHGEGHSIPPHRVNYRANIATLKQAGADRILAVGSVGGIGAGCEPGALVVPDQLIDYTGGREQTFAGPGDPVLHVDFTDPYSPGWRSDVLEAARREAPVAGVPLVEGGVYGATDGPRFETAAEIARLRQDGCTVVGMTGMPEAVLAREAGLEYAAVCPVGNLAAGIAPGQLDQDQVFATSRSAMPLVIRLVTVLA